MRKPNGTSLFLYLVFELTWLGMGLGTSLMRILFNAFIAWVVFGAVFRFARSLSGIDYWGDADGAPFKLAFVFAIVYHLSIEYKRALKKYRLQEQSVEFVQWYGVLNASFLRLYLDHLLSYHWLNPKS